MTTIALVNEKGGVAKTTLAINIACGLAYRGKNVMLIDGDPQGHATLRLGVKKYPGLYDLIVREGDWGQLAYKIAPARFGIPGEQLPENRLFLLGGNIETRSIQNHMDNVTLLGERIEELKEANAIDVFIIDTSPTPSLLHALFYMAADALIYPTTLSYTSFDGLIESVTHRLEANKARDKRYSLPPIDVLGIVPTKYRKGTIAEDSNLEKLRSKFGKMVWSPIDMRTVWTQAEDQALPVYALDANSPAAMDVWEMVDRVEEYMHVKA